MMIDLLFRQKKMYTQSRGTDDKPPNVRQVSTAVQNNLQSLPEPTASVSNVPICSTVLSAKTPDNEVNFLSGVHDTF